MSKDKGFCPTCKNMYVDNHVAFGTCPKGHILLHETKCQTCNTKMYFQTDDDYCGPDDSEGIYCSECVKKMIKEGNDSN